MQNNSKINTVLLIVLILLVGFGLWKTYSPKEGIVINPPQEEVTTDKYGRYVSNQCEVQNGSTDLISCVEKGAELGNYAMVMLPEFACYKNSNMRCEKQTSGKCGWTVTSEFNSCVDSARKSNEPILPVTPKDTVKNTPKLLTVCPEEKINATGGVMYDPNDKINHIYYIYKGVRREISEFDAVWVKNNCTVKEQAVY